MQPLNDRRIRRWVSWMAVPVVLAFLVTAALSQNKKDAEKARKPAEPPQAPPNKTSYDQVAPALLGQVTFQEMMARDKADKPAVMARQKSLLEERYNLASRPD